MYASLSHVFAHVPGAWSSVLEAVLATAAIGIGVVLGQQLVVLRHSAGSGISLN